MDVMYFLKDTALTSCEEFRDEGKDFSREKSELKSFLETHQSPSSSLTERTNEPIANAFRLAHSNTT